MATEQEIAAVRRICEHWATMSAADFAEVMSPDCDYRNIPIEGDHHVGPDDAHATLARFGERWEITLEIRHLVAGDGVVLTERNEHFVHRHGAKPSFDLPVMGTFEVRDGKVTAWRDYFERTHLRLR